MINESQKRILKLMGLNEQISINSPSFEGLKIEKPTSQQINGDRNQAWQACRTLRKARRFDAKVAALWYEPH